MCTPYRSYMPNTKTCRDLKSKLALLHSLGITHNDIKEDNIMLSPSKGQLVFIDFNCSSIVSEKPGFKTLTTFKGTPDICSEEMFRLFNQNYYGHVDLFYNDAYTLQKLIDSQQVLEPKQF